MVTARGAGVLAGWSVLMAIGILSGPRGLIPLLAAGGATLISAPVIAWWRGRRASRLRLVARPVPAAVAVGTPCELRIVAAGGDPRLRGLAIDRPDGRSGPRGWTRGWLAPGPERLLQLTGPTVAVAVPTDRRGLLQIGPLRAWVQDPLGLFSVRVARTAAVTVVVHPGSESRAGARTAPPPAARTDGELQGLRPYVPGDRLHLIDWRCRAAFGILVVRQFGNEQASTSRIVLDDRRGVHRRKDFELLLSALVHVTTEALGAGRRIDLWMLSGRRLEIAPTSSGVASILLATATLQPRAWALTDLPPSEMLLTTATGDSRLTDGLRRATTVVTVP